MKLSDTVLKYEEQVALALRELYGSHGYAPFRMSRFEEYDLYVRNKSFLVSDSVITFTDTDGKLMALKPDVTLSIVKNCRPAKGAQEKVYYNENVFRVSRGTHAFREIGQTGLECIGDLDVFALSEVLTLAAESLALIDAEYVLDLSHLGVVGAAIDALGVDGECRTGLLAALGEKNPHGVRALLNGAGATGPAADAFLALLTAEGAPKAVLPRLFTAFAGNEAATAALSELEAVLSALGEGTRVRLDFSVVHDMHYYSGIVFRGFVPRVSAGILAGGQYDRLVRKLGRASGAVGFAVYLDLLEERTPRREGLDCDVFLLYGEDDAPAAVREAALALRRDGARVRTGSALPEGLRCGRILTVKEAR
ncbi:MAG: ATP phosphoribosyltransferase regulatory subunit [Clostridia bacterium]|nr:ATP phosphoribosyltransferase regulatory subunit [Clostridia bacterium]